MPVVRATATITAEDLMKKQAVQSGRKHGLRAKISSESRLKTTLTFEPGAQAYHWTTDRGRSRSVIKH
jgi:hypothetical protein